jgi:UDP:flavonoid glycosyltransferase YjiC (YdhE family)
MKFVITAVGTTGDVHPFIALSQALAARGHQATICSYAMHAAKCEAAGVAFRTVAPVVGKDDLNGAASATLQKRSDTLAQIGFLVDLFLRDGHQRYLDCVEATREADVVLCHHMDFPGQLAAMKNGKRWAAVGYCPFVVPNADWAPHYERLIDFGPTLNKKLWGVAAWVQDKWLFRRVAAFCAEHGMPRHGLWTWMASPDLNLIAASPAIAVAPRRLPPRTLVTGAWHLDEPGGTHEPLARFLARGTRPAVFTFGSMGSTDAASTTAAMIEAARRAKMRAIIQTGWAGLQVGDAGDDVLFVDYVPHGLLFRDAACIVHHGGAGTAWAATRAGVPSVVVAHGADQYYWGQCLNRRGVAPMPLRRPAMTGRRLGALLAEVQGNAAYAARAHALSAELARETGLANAVQALEALGPRPVELGKPA